MSSVLLVYPPYLSKYKNIPLGLAYLASYNQKKGIDVKIIDMDAQGVSLTGIGNIIRNENPAIVAISFMTNQFGNAVRIAGIAKKINKNIKIVMGGNHATALPDELINTGSVDYVVAGEGEVTSNELFQSILDGTDYEKKYTINGLAFKDDDKIIKTQNRELIEDLDKLPFPLRDDLPFERYSEKIIGTKLKGKAFSILSSRGCPAKCNFCSSHTVFTRKFRYRSAENILDEMTYLHEKFGAMQFNFVDDTFTIKRERVENLCRILISGKKPFEWIVNARVNSVDADLLKLMYRAGCRNINFGVESGDEEVRSKVGKAITRDQIIEAHRSAKKAGIIVSSYFMVGNLGEDWRSIEKTISFIKELKTDYPSCTIATPYPDTDLFYTCKDNGWIRTFNWDEYYTTPHLIPHFRPVSHNGILSIDEILKAYYHVNRKMLSIKLKTKYSFLFLLNFRFWRDEIFSRIFKLKFSGLYNLVKKTLFSKISLYL